MEGGIRRLVVGKLLQRSGNRIERPPPPVYIGISLKQAGLGNSRGAQSLPPLRVGGAGAGAGACACDAGRETADRIGSDRIIELYVDFLPHAAVSAERRERSRWWARRWLAAVRVLQCCSLTCGRDADAGQAVQVSGGGPETR